MDGLRYLPSNKASILNCLNILVQRTVKILRVVFSLHHIPNGFPANYRKALSYSSRVG